MERDVKARIKLAKAKRKGQQKLFTKRLDVLFRTEYRYSLRFEEAHVFDDGKAYINVDLTKIDSPFSVYSYDNRFNEEIFDYINQETEFLPNDIPVVVNFDDDGKYTEEMKTKIKKAVIRHYSLEYEDERYALHKSRRFGFFCMLTGFMFMMLYIGLSLLLINENYSDFRFVTEVINIFSWVFIWESVDRFVLSGLEQTESVFNAGQLALMEIQFGKPMVKNK
jgi:hypothetical protein